MNSEYISLIALVVSLLSLLVSFIALYRDRFVIKARACAIIVKNKPIMLQVSVANSGKRPINTNSVLIRPKDTPGYGISFHQKVDIGEEKSININPKAVINDSRFPCKTVDEIQKYPIYVIDSLSNEHKVKF